MDANDIDRAANRLCGSSFGQYILNQFGGWWAREVAYSELMSLDENMLKDIGVARCEFPGFVVFKVVQPEAANEDRPTQWGTASEKRRRYSARS